MLYLQQKTQYTTKNIFCLTTLKSLKNIVYIWSICRYAPPNETNSLTTFASLVSFNLKSLKIFFDKIY